MYPNLFLSVPAERISLLKIPSLRATPVDQESDFPNSDALMRSSGKA